ncbi:MAG: phospho-N-acetylmuramoyl-pentapeptide-transferase [Candidatus Bipolaricaulota bacterium]|nr:MAG: phospho-N-acetylmuramoyl-pentapeptide-transferase [Candidatus Bipolaricaulota bacterium]
MIAPLLAALVLVPVTAIACGAFARAMRHAAIGQHVRRDGPRVHVGKAGTPIMGGVVILSLWGVALLTLRSTGGVPRAAWAVYASAAAFGAVGWADDLLALRRRGTSGLSVLQKLVLCGVVAAGLFFGFRDLFDAAVRVPFTTIAISLSSAATALLTIVVFTATTNSMNLTDGQDGLATGVTLILGAALLLAAPEASGLPALLPLLGCLGGFLWVNAHPARLFLGDVGSFALGGAVAAFALAEGLAFALPLFAGVLVLEALSVITQVGVYRLTGRRLLRMSPMHHHFELPAGPPRAHLLPAVDLPESKITVRLWIVEALFAALAIISLRVG